MPLYDFRCADCAHRREVHASIDTADGLELVCVDCGGTMTKAVTGVNIVLTIGVAASPPPRARPAPARRGHTCTDGAVKLTRPNPLQARQ